MTDEEAIAHEPAARELVEAVMSRDVDHVAVCLAHTDPVILAVLCAEYAGRARAALGEAQKALKATHDIRPAGMTRMRAWEISQESEERKTA